MVTAERKFGRGPQPKTERNDALVTLVNAGLSLSEAARKFGISPERARQIYNNARPKAEEV